MARHSVGGVSIMHLHHKVFPHIKNYVESAGANDDTPDGAYWQLHVEGTMDFNTEYGHIIDWYDIQGEYIKWSNKRAETKPWHALRPTQAQIDNCKSQGWTYEADGYFSRGQELGWFTTSGFHKE